MTDDPERYIELLRDDYWYYGPIALGKGGNSQAEMQNADQQRAMEDRLAQQQLNLQKQQLSAVNAVVDPAIQAGGFFPGQEAAMTSLLTNNLANQYRNAVANTNQSLVARGLSGGQIGAGGGGVAGSFGLMNAMLGNQQQQGLSQIQLDKANQLQGLLGLKLGIGSQYGGNIGTFNSGATGALNAGVTAANNADQAQTSWLGPTLGALTGLGGKITYGGSSGFGFGCWAAEACYGSWEDPRVKFVRARLWDRAINELIFKVIVVVYMCIGKTVAKFIRRFGWFKLLMTEVFDRFIISEMDYLLNKAVKNG